MRISDLSNTKWAVYNSFENNILIIGWGGLGQCVLHLILRHFKLNTKKITVIEADDKHDLFNERYNGLGIEYYSQEITKENINSILNSKLKSGDLLINVSLNIDGITIVDWCQKNNVLYIDTSIENWPGEYQTADYPFHSRTLYESHKKMKEHKLSIWPKNSATALVSHGANPGLITHFTKKGLLDIANFTNLSYTYPTCGEDWAQLSWNLGVKVIHDSERDTQIINKPKEKNEFINTWSVEGFWAEGSAPAELGWGTHEPILPSNLKFHNDNLTNAAFLTQPGVRTLMKSWVPLGGNIEGYLVQHSEAITINNLLTLYDGDEIIYSPTVHYVYKPCDGAINSVDEMRMNDYNLQKHNRLVTSEVISGIDELGSFLMGDNFGAWWTGTQLSIEEARSLLPFTNATELPVAAGVIAGIAWILKYPNLGYIEPEDIDHEFILSIANQYLGDTPSTHSNWSPIPITNKKLLFPKKFNISEKYSFNNFLV